MSSCCLQGVTDVQTVTDHSETEGNWKTGRFSGRFCSQERVFFFFWRWTCLFDDVMWPRYDGLLVWFQDLGSSAGSKRPTCVILIKPHQEYQDAYDECVEEVSGLPKPLWGTSQSVSSSEVTASIEIRPHFKGSSCFSSAAPTKPQRLFYISVSPPDQ